MTQTCVHPLTPSVSPRPRRSHFVAGYLLICLLAARWVPSHGGPGGFHAEPHLGGQGRPGRGHGEAQIEGQQRLQLGRAVEGTDSAGAARVAAADFDLHAVADGDASSYGGAAARMYHTEPVASDAESGRALAGVQQQHTGDSSRPANTASSTPVGSVGLSVAFEAARNELGIRLQRQQFPSDDSCGNRRLLVFPYYLESGTHGFSVIFQYLASALVVAHESNRTLVEISEGGAESDRWPRAPMCACHGEKFGCYFEPLSSCAFRPTYAGHTLSLPVLDTMDPLGQPDKVVTLPSLQVATPLFQQVTKASNVPTWFTAAGGAANEVLPDGTVLPLDPDFDTMLRRLWFPAFELYLFRPRASLLPEDTRELADLVRQFNTSIAVHVRHGDVAALAYRRTRSLDDHLKMALDVIAAQGVATDPDSVPLVFASDNGTAREVVGWAVPSPFVAVQADAPVLQSDPLHLESWIRDADHGASSLGAALKQLTRSQAPSDSIPSPDGAAAHPGFLLTGGVIQDIYLMSFANHFVGSCMSQVSRLASELMFARGLMKAPPVGFDAALCRSFPTHFYSIELPWTTSGLASPAEAVPHRGW